MGTFKLDVWLENSKGISLQGCWQADLVIQALTGDYLADYWPEVVAQLQARYSTWTISKEPMYWGHTRIRFRPPAGTYVQEIEIDIPPNSYKVWCRCCFGGNEETNINRVIGECGDHVPCRLLLNSLGTCAGHIAIPLLHAVVKEQALHDDVERVALAKGVLWGANMGRDVFIQQLQQQRLAAVYKNDTILIAEIDNVIALANQIPACC